MVKIFISYRRDDTNGIVGRIDDRLVNEFGRKNVFKDVDSIPLGSDFRHILGEAVSQCDVLLAVIGKGWLGATDRAGKRRLEAKNDFVRVEVEAALERGIPVIPVLVDGASVPTAEELPESLRNLSFRHGAPVRHDPDFNNDMGKLVAALKRPRPVRAPAVARKAANPRPQPPSQPETSPRVRGLGLAIVLPLVLVAGIFGAGYWWPAGPVAEDPGLRRDDYANSRTASRPKGSEHTPPARVTPNLEVKVAPPPTPAGDWAPAGDAELRTVFGQIPLGTSNDTIGVGLWIASPINRSDLPIFQSLADAMREAGARLTAISFPKPDEFAFLGERIVRVDDPRQLLDRANVDAVIIHGLLRDGAFYPSLMGEQAPTPVRRASLALLWSSEANHDSFLIMSRPTESFWKPNPLSDNKLANGKAALEASLKYRRIIGIGNPQRGNDFGEFFSSVRSREPGPSQISSFVK